MSSEHTRKQRLALFKRQRGLCHWCKGKMFIRPDGRSKGTREDAATIDHLHPRGHPERGKHGNEFTHVLACKKCNGERNSDFMATLDKEKLWAASGRAPQQQSPDS